jgi:hydrogenase maturation protease
MRALVVGVGSPDRGDDGVGALVVDELQRRRRPDVTAVVAASPSRLLDLWVGHCLVVVVDAARTRRRVAGTVSITSVDEQPLPAGGRSAGTHGFGVADAVELARALGRVPDRVFLVTIEAAAFEQGAPLSPAVAAAVSAAADAAVGLLDERGRLQTYGEDNRAKGL